MQKSKVVNYLFSCFVLFIGVASCGQIEKSPPADYPETETYFDFLEILEMSTTEKLRSDELRLYIENKTEDCIVFSNDYGLQIFADINGTWVQIPNLAKYVGDSEIILTTYPGERPFDSVYLLPDYSSFDGIPRIVRVLFHAFRCKDGVPTVEMVSDFIDIDLEK